MSPISPSPVVLITGCSSGIGRETARRFAARGYAVHASMRRPERPEGVSLREEARAHGWRLTVTALDVTDGVSVETAVGTLLAETGGRLDVLVHNAGYLLTGPLEETSPDELGALFDTQVAGAHRVTRAVLPAMRQRRDGCIVFVSSIAARTVIPVLGAYSAAKSALEVMAEAWRYELTPFGIRVVIVEPGGFHTALHRNEVRSGGGPGSPYAPLVARFADHSRRLSRWPVERAARTIERAATVPRPALRWPVGPLSLVGGRIRPIAPDRWLEWWLRRAFGLNPRRGG